MAILIILLLLNSRSGIQNDRYQDMRERMVANQIEARGINDPSTLRAMRKVPRHLFVPDDLKNNAYDDFPLPIGYGQTISQPYIVAYMTQAARVAKRKKVLEIGTGSGYQAAVLAEIADTVYTIEIVKELAEKSAVLLKSLGYKNIVTRSGDGYNGWPEEAPFDIIIVTAAPREVPSPLIDQLAENGRMIIPVGGRERIQDLLMITKRKGKTERRILAPVRFVPLTRPAGRDQ